MTKRWFQADVGILNRGVTRRALNMLKYKLLMIDATCDIIESKYFLGSMFLVVVTASSKDELVEELVNKTVDLIRVQAG